MINQSRHIPDWQQILSNLDGDNKLLCDIIRVFQRDSIEDLNLIETAIKQKDVVVLNRSAHKFKGALVTLNMEDAAHLALALEQLGESGNIEGAEDIFKDLCSEVEYYVSLQNAYLEAAA